MSRRFLVLLLLLAVATATVLVVRSALSVDTQGAKVEHFTIHSRYVNRDLRQAVAIPAEASSQHRPLLVFLHGRGGKGEDSNLNNEMFSALKSLPDPPLIVFPSGGDHSYWHDRKDGSWGKYVIHEVIPQAVKRFHADGRRVAIGGISMGGFGAFDLARLYPERFCAVGGHSPALWQTGAETAPGAFDDAEDFRRHNVIGAASADPSIFAGKPLWLDAGTEDPFLPGDRAFVQALKSSGIPITVHYWPGEHTDSYWRSHWKPYLRFYAQALKHCN